MPKEKKLAHNTNINFFKCENVDFMKSILLQIPTGFFVCDKECRILFINNVYASYLDKKPEEIIGKNINDIFSDAVVPFILKTGKPMFGALRKIKKGNNYIQIIVNRIPLFDDQDNIKGVMVMALADTPEQLSNLTMQMEKLSPFNKNEKQSPFRANYTIDSIIGDSILIQQMKAYLVKYAQMEAPVLILGETGTGKELTASAIHTSGPRANGPFIALNCSVFPTELFESELFGYAPGSFSGANKEGKIGQIELANNGTLFLDEIGDLPLQMQVKLLRVLEEKKIYPIGSTEAKPVDFRLVTATNRNLQAMIDKGMFREDFFYRINALILNIPSLDERKEDIPLIANNILQKLNASSYYITPQAMDFLINFSWKGNIRELNNVITRALGLCKNNQITINDLPEYFQQNTSKIKNEGKLKIECHKNEENIILRSLQKNMWNVKKTAEELGISRANMYEKMKKARISRPK